MNPRVRRVLTHRQGEVLYLLAEGKIPDDIASILHITRRTVYFHLYRAMETLKCSTCTQAVAMAIRKGKI